MIATWQPRKAFVLAAGLGTRMDPLSRYLPKPLMPFWGRPLLAHILDQLAGWGVEDIAINCHHHPAQVFEFVRRRRAAGGPRLRLSFEPAILGTGGALRQADWFFGDGEDDPFWLVNADVALDLDPRRMAAQYHRHRPLAVLWLHDQLGPRTVAVQGATIRTFRSPAPGAAGTHTFCGLHLVSPRVLQYLPEHGFASIIAAYEKALRHGDRILGHWQPDAFWADLGLPGQYLAAHAEALARRRAHRPGGRLVAAAELARQRSLARRGVRVAGFASVAADARIARGAQLENAVVWPGAILSAGAVARNVIVGPGARVSGPVRHMAVPAAGYLTGAETAALRRLRRPGRVVEDLGVEVFPPRGSARSFMRLRSGHATLILVRYSAERPENIDYAAHSRFLRGLGLPVPAVFWHDARRQFLLMEDAGDTHLVDILHTWPAARQIAFYEQVLTAMIAFHEQGYAAARRRSGLRLQPPFTPDLYARERKLCRDEFLCRHLGLTAGRARAILRDLARAARPLETVAPRLVHRDLQSSNILVAGGRCVFIDFQGMRLGPALYDLASLLCDPYVMLPAAMQERLLAFYARGQPGAADPDLFWRAAIQRLGQAVGAYARLGRIAGMAHFHGYIAPALRMLRHAAGHLGVGPALRDFLAEFGGPGG